MSFAIRKKNKAFSKELHESGCQEVVTCRHEASKDLENSRGWDVSKGKAKIEKIDGSCSRQKE